MQSRLRCVTKGSAQQGPTCVSDHAVSTCRLEGVPAEQTARSCGVECSAPWCSCCLPACWRVCAVLCCAAAEDVYVHAELHGASSTIIRNHDPSRPVPPLTLQQAGCACVCRSRAWDSKVVTSAWWVHHHQVSRQQQPRQGQGQGQSLMTGQH